MADSITDRVSRLEQKVYDIDERGSRGVGRLETAVARIEERVMDIDARLNASANLALTVATIGEKLITMKATVDELKFEFDEREREMKKKRDDERKERKQTRIALYGLAVTIIVALVGAATVLLSAGGH